jgi:hypothetical protein
MPKGVYVHKPLTEECKKKLRIANRGNKLCGIANFKGEDALYRAKHFRVEVSLGKESVCNICNRTDQKQYEWANSDHSYDKNSEYRRLCASCHRRIDKGWKFVDGKWFKKCNGCGIFMEVCLDNFYARKSGAFVSICKKCSIKLTSNNK